MIYALVMSAFALPRGAAIAVALMIQAIQVLQVTALALVLAPGAVTRQRSASSEA